MICEQSSGHQDCSCSFHQRDGKRRGKTKNRSRKKVTSSCSLAIVISDQSRNTANVIGKSFISDETKFRGNLCLSL